MTYQDLLKHCDDCILKACYCPLSCGTILSNKIITNDDEVQGIEG